MRGIDVSNFQGNIDWKKVKASGIDFVIIRAGWGKNGRDSKFKEYINGAINAGIKNIGIYWFLYAKNENDIVGNANGCVSTIGAYKDNINFKVWADWEYDSDNYCKGLNKATRTQWVKRFCQEVAKQGFEVGIYANPDYIKNKFNDISDYPLWLAFYSNSKGSYNPLIWQYTSKGSINGIKGNVDLDEFYGEILSVPFDKIKDIEATVKPCSPKVNPYKEPTVILKKGSRGEGVKWLQWELKDAGYSNIAIDGIFGNDTDAKTRDFQSKHKLVVDGKVGVNTKRALKEV